jgi:hypothetical protein
MVKHGKTHTSGTPSFQAISDADKVTHIDSKHVLGGISFLQARKRSAVSDAVSDGPSSPWWWHVRTTSLQKHPTTSAGMVRNSLLRGTTRAVTRSGHPHYPLTLNTVLTLSEGLGEAAVQHEATLLRTEFCS